jgi:hypothetical protein
MREEGKKQETGKLSSLVYVCLEELRHIDVDVIKWV